MPTCARTRAIGVFDDVADAPSGFAAADLAHEALEDLRALQRVRDFGMELHAVEARATHRTIAASGALALTRDGDETRRQRLDAVAVAHPHIEHARPCASLAIAQIRRTACMAATRSTCA